MSKPQFAAEPSMEEILSSIRRMISDDKPGPNPIPDQMARTPFAGGSPAAPAEPSRGPASVSHLAPAPAASPSFSSLSDALKAATTTSEQRRQLQQEIAEVLERGPPRGGRSELSTFAPVTPNAAPARSEPNQARNVPSHNAAPAAGAHSLRTALDGLHSLPDGGKSAAAETGSESPTRPYRAAGPAANGAASQRDFNSFDFGTHVPQRDASGSALRVDQNGQPIPVAKPAGDPSPTAERQQAEPQAIELSKSEGQRIIAMPSRTGMNGSGLNGATVAPFPRPVRDGVKASHAAPAADPASALPDEKGDRQPVSAALDEARAADAAINTEAAHVALSHAVSEEPRTKPEPSPAQSAASEALLDAVVDMVQKQPESLSVFTSGASFISGVSAKPTAVDNLVATMSGKPGAPPKMDKAAAELLRPMLRQWLSDNMPRIVEEALRSELMSTQSGGDGGKGS